jgi:hypothetical protein
MPTCRVYLVPWFKILFGKLREIVFYFVIFCNLINILDVNADSNDAVAIKNEIQGFHQLPCRLRPTRPARLYSRELSKLLSPARQSRARASGLEQADRCIVIHYQTVDPADFEKFPSMIGLIDGRGLSGILGLFFLKRWPRKLHPAGKEGLAAATEPAMDF